MIVFYNVYRQRAFWSNVRTFQSHVYRLGFVYMERAPVIPMHYKQHNQLFGCSRAQVIHHWEVGEYGSLASFGEQYKARLNNHRGMVVLPMMMTLPNDSINQSIVQALYEVCHYYPWQDIMAVQPWNRNLKIIRAMGNHEPIQSIDDVYLTWSQISRRVKDHARK